MSKKASKSEGPATVTPLMAQYAQVKATYPEAILLFRVGDFYETFGEDAVKASKALGITLTSRNNGGSDMELAGFPHHAMDMYLPRLVRAGYRVAICEQMEKPVPGKVVKRSVTEVVTPGVTTVDALLEHNQNNYLLALAIGKNDQYGLAFLDISTGEFFVSEGDAATADKLIQSFKPAEIVVPKSGMKAFNAQFGDKFYLSTLEDWIFTLDFGREKLLNHFQVSSLKGYGIEEAALAQCAAGAALHYLATTENNRLSHIGSLSRLQPAEFVWLDRFTIRNLELISSNHETGVSLLQVLDKTVSPMGARLLKKWVLLPLTNLRQIEERLDSVEFLLKNTHFSDQLSNFIRQIGDLERLMGKTAIGKINPREMLQLRRALGAIQQLKAALAEMPSAPASLLRTGEALNPCFSLYDRILSTLAPDPPVDVRKGGAIAEGANPQLDEYRHIVKNARDLLLGIQQREAERTGITSLKIGFNNVFGYYIEVTSKWKDQVPSDWIRKQTIANGERFITDELKQLEAKILGAEEKILELEDQVFRLLVEEVFAYIAPIQLNAQNIARLDCLQSFAQVALVRQYTRPQLSEGFELDIQAGRHPVIETQLPIGEPFVPNDVRLSRDEVQVILITGPNMAGKSALLRQTALIVLMAQMGCYVPAASATIGWCDKVFTRVGASDNISGGESTFMVEMNETALIMNNISDRSLILLDEIGRGTSTYDGISIAWSLVEYLHNNGRARPKTLFATHYHELNELATSHERVHNFHVSTREVGQKVVFLRKLVPGGSNHSFGIHVARIAGMPPAIVERAQVILKTLEEKHIEQEDSASKVPVTEDLKQKVKGIGSPVQLQIFDVDEYTRQIKEELLALDLNKMTPIDALWKLNELVKIAGRKNSG